jgi:hypothetical protein
MTSKKIKMEEDLKKKKKKKKGRRPKQKWKTNQSTKINLIGCDTIVNSPSLVLFFNNPPTHPDRKSSKTIQHSLVFSPA